MFVVCNCLLHSNIDPLVQVWVHPPHVCGLRIYVCLFVCVSVCMYVSVCMCMCVFPSLRPALLNIETGLLDILFVTLHNLNCDIVVMQI